MPGVAIQILDRADLHDLAEVHDPDAIAEVLDHRKVVADEQVGQIEVTAQVEQQVEHLALDGHVEGGYGLVAHDEFRLEGESAGDPDSLPLGAGEPGRVPGRVPPRRGGP